MSSFAGLAFADTTAARSQALWASCPVRQLITREIDGFWTGDDFTEEYATSGNRYKVLEADSSVVVGPPTTTVKGGLQRILLDATDENEAGWVAGNGSQGVTLPASGSGDI